ncbi:MAG: lysine biosynthesis protein LysX [Phycisphaerales bacterium]
MHIALLHLRVRVEERLLYEALASVGARVEMIDLRRVVFDPERAGDWDRFDAVLDRSLSLTCSLNATRILEGFGLRCINSSLTAEVCGDKLRTTIALMRAGVPTPAVRVALDAESAVQAVEQIGYPCVIKPTIGSWGRLVARVNDRDAAEAVIEHRDQLGSTHQHVYYVQEHINKPGRDIRVFVVGGCAIAAIVRTSTHWITNTARGAEAGGLTVSPDMADLCRRAAQAVGADVCAIDLLECPRRGLLVNEVNHSMEFRNSIDTTGINIPLRIAEHVMLIARAQRDAAGPMFPVVRTDREVHA